MKKFARLIRYADKPLFVIILFTLLGIFAGLSGFAFIYLINTTTDLLMSGEMKPYDQYYIGLFAITILIFMISRRAMSKYMIDLSQNVFWNIRKDIVKLLTKSKFYETQRLKDEIYAGVHNDAGAITNASVLVIEFGTSLILVVSCLAYMAYLSFPLFCFTFATIVIGMVTYHFSVKRNNKRFVYARELESRFLKNFDDIFFGLKEINMEPQKGDDILNKKMIPIINDAQYSNKRGLVGYLNSQIFGTLVFYILIAFLLLHVGFMLEIEAGKIINFTVILLYLFAPIESVMLTIPGLNRASIAFSKLLYVVDELTVEEKLDKAQKNLTSFNSIAVSSLEYGYQDKDNFTMGPISLNILPSEILFIYGGNGSGKSTFIKVLLQLYQETGGHLKLNGNKVDRRNRAEYRTLFAVVFSDFYLFDELHGIDQVSVEQANEYLRLFEIEEKVSITDGVFSTVDLSTGQRKRLAIVYALLENKPILVLDEWAADQDPHFRAKFYNIVIPLLKEKGITVIAITHDDAYYDIADRIYKMDYGKLKEVTEERLALGKELQKVKDENLLK